MLKEVAGEGCPSVPGQLVVRAFSPGERELLAAKLKDKCLPAKIHERYRIVAMVAEGMSANAAAKAVGCTDVKGRALGPSL